MEYWDPLVGVHQLALDVLKGWVGIQPLGGVLVCAIVAGVVWWCSADWLMKGIRRRAKERARANRQTKR